MSARDDAWAVLALLGDLERVLHPLPRGGEVRTAPVFPPLLPRPGEVSGEAFVDTRRPGEAFVAPDALWAPATERPRAATRAVASVPPVVASRPVAVQPAQAVPEARAMPEARVVPGVPAGVPAVEPAWTEPPLPRTPVAAPERPVPVPLVAERPEASVVPPPMEPLPRRAPAAAAPVSERAEAVEPGVSTPERPRAEAPPHAAAEAAQPAPRDPIAPPLPVRPPDVAAPTLERAPGARREAPLPPPLPARIERPDPPAPVRAEVAEAEVPATPVPLRPDPIPPPLPRAPARFEEDEVAPVPKRPRRPRRSALGAGAREPLDAARVPTPPAGVSANRSPASAGEMTAPNQQDPEHSVSEDVAPAFEDFAVDVFALAEAPLEDDGDDEVGWIVVDGRPQRLARGSLRPGPRADLLRRLMRRR